MIVSSKNKEGNITGWWLSPTPLKNDGVRQLGWLYISQYMKNKQCLKPTRWRLLKTPSVGRYSSFDKLYKTPTGFHTCFSQLKCAIMPPPCEPRYLEHCRSLACLVPGRGHGTMPMGLGATWWENQMLEIMMYSKHTLWWTNIAMENGHL